MTNDMSFIPSFVDHAADKDMRWWFLCLLVCVLAGFVMIVRYLIKRDEKKSDQMHEAFEKNQAVIVKLEVTLAMNADAMRNCARALEDYNKETRLDRRSQ